MRVIDTFPLESEGWWEYYRPLRRRVGELGESTAGNSALAQMLNETEREITVFERYGDAFGYQFFLMQRMP